MNIVFYFGENGDDIKTADIIKDGFQLSEIYHNELKPADNGVKCKIPYDMQIADALKININRDIKIRIEDVDRDGVRKNIFVGYLQKSAKFEKTQRNQPISLNIVSPSYFLDKTLDSAIVAVSKSVEYIIKALLKKANVNEYGKIKIPQVLPYFSAEKGKSIKAILTELCFEYGKSYYFDNNGVFQLCELFSDLPLNLKDIKQTFDGSNCLEKITITAKEKDADAIRATFKGVEVFNNTLLFSDTQNAKDSDKCQIEIQPNKYIFDEKYNKLKYDSEHGTVLYVKSIKSDCIFDSGVEWNIERFDQDRTDLLTEACLTAKNTTGSKRYCRKLDIYGDAFIQTKINTVVSSEGTKEKEFTLEYIYDSEDAKDFARNLANYYRYCNFVLTLKSAVDYPLGSFVTVNDYGIGTYIARITKKTKKLTEKAISYTLENISEYEPCTAQEYASAIDSAVNKSGKNGIAGKQGEAGEKGEAGSTIYCYLENDNVTFGVDPEGKTQGFSADIFAHVISNYKELPFKIGKIGFARGMTITPLWKCPAVKNGIHIELEKGTELTGQGSIKIEVIYNDIEESHLYGRITDKSARLFKDHKLKRAFGGFTYKKNIVPVIYELELQWTLTKIGVYRGAMDSIHGFLEPDTETPLYYSDYFTWTATTNATAEYNGHSVTFEPSCVYKWNGAYWEKDDSDEHNSTALSDVLKTNAAFLSQNNSTVDLFLKRLVTNNAFIDKLVANTAFIQKLFAEHIVINQTGDIKSAVFDKQTGFCLSASGQFTCVNGDFNGSIHTGALIVENKTPGTIAFKANAGKSFYDIWEYLRQNGVFEGEHSIRGTFNGLEVKSISFKITSSEFTGSTQYKVFRADHNHGFWVKHGHGWASFSTWENHDYDVYNLYTINTYRSGVIFYVTTTNGNQKSFSGYDYSQTRVDNGRYERHDGTCPSSANRWLDDVARVSSAPATRSWRTGNTSGICDFVLDEDCATLCLKNIPRANYSGMPKGTVYADGNGVLRIRQ